MNINNVSNSPTFQGAFIRTPQFVKFRRSLSTEDRKLLDGYLKNIAAFPDNAVYKYWTVSSYARISQAQELREKEIIINYRKELNGSTNKTLFFTNPKTKRVQEYPLVIMLKSRKGKSLEMFKNLSDFYVALKRNYDELQPQ